MIKVDTILDKECRNAMFKAAKNVKKTKNVKIFTTCCFLFFLLAGLFYLYLAFNPGIEGKSVTCGILGVLFIVLAFFGSRIIFKLREAPLRNKTAEELTAHYAFSEEGVVITGKMSEGKYQWGAFDRHGMQDHYLWIRRAQDKAFVMVDKNKLSAEDAAQLEAWFDAVKEAE